MPTIDELLQEAESEASRYGGASMDDLLNMAEGKPVGGGGVPVKDAIQSLPGQIYRGARELITGESRMQGQTAGGVPYADIPELSSINPNTVGASAGGMMPLNPANIPTSGSTIPAGFSASLNTAQGNPMTQAAIIKSRLNVPDSAIEFTPDLDVIVTFPQDYQDPSVAGQSFWANEPGISSQDFQDLGHDAIAYGSALLPGQKVASPIARGVVTGLSEGAVSAGMDIAADAMTKENIPIDKTRAAIMTGLGLAGDVALPVAGRLLDRIFAKPLFDDAGVITAEGRKAFEKIGVDPDVVTPDMAAGWRASSGGTEADSRVLEAGALPTPVQLSEGQATRDLAAQRIEQQAQSGILGDEAQAEAQDFLNRQQQALAESGEQIRADIAGQDVNVRGEGVALTREQVRKAEKKARNNVRDAYKAARLTNDMQIPANDIMGPIRELLPELKREFNPRNPDMANANIAMEELDTTITMLRNGQVKNPYIKMGALSDWRKQINGLLSAEYKNRGEANASDVVLLRLKRQYDNSLDELISGEMERLTKGQASTIKGSKDPLSDLSAWMSANKMRTAYGQQFKDDTMVRNFYSKDVDAETAANKILGAGKLGVAGTSNTVNRIADIIGRDSAGFKALQGEAALQIMMDGAGNFNPTIMRKNLDRLKNKNPATYKALFNARQRRTLESLANVAKNTAYDKTTNALNPSGSGAAAILGAMRRNFGPVWQGIEAVTKTAGGSNVSRSYGKTSASDSFNRNVSKTPLFEGRVAALEGVTLGGKETLHDPKGTE